jgi:hypothetical protein
LPWNCHSWSSSLNSEGPIPTGTIFTLKYCLTVLSSVRAVFLFEMNVFWLKTEMESGGDACSSDMEVISAEGH